MKGKYKSKILIFTGLFFVAVFFAVFILLSSHKSSLNDTSFVEKYPNMAYKHLGYYKGAKFPIHLNFENQEERFDATDDFCNYLLATLDNGDTFCNLDSIIAYKIDLNDDGYDEIIGFVKQSNLAEQRNGYKLEILIPSEIYKMQNPDVEEFDEDILGWQRISYHTKALIDLKLGIYVMPQKTNGYHDLHLYSKNGDFFERVVKKYNPDLKRYGFERELYRSLYLRFNNARSPYYKYELYSDLVI